MVIEGFDGKNARFILDAVEVKVLFGFLDMASAAQANKVAERVVADGFERTPNECLAIARSNVAMVRELVQHIARRVQPDEIELDEDETDTPPRVM
jgi:hypothetical protein